MRRTRGLRNGMLLGCAAASLSCAGEIAGAGAGVGDQPGATPGLAAEPPVGAPADGCAVPERRLWKLTPPQLDATLATLVTLPSVAPRLRGTLSGALGGYSNEAARLEMSAPHVATLFDVAREAAASALDSGGAVSACRAAMSSADCVAGLVADFGARAFRRPLTSEELLRYRSFFANELTASDPDTALSQLVRALLLSPHFQYRTELGTKAGDSFDLDSFDLDSFDLEGFERAQILSYSLADAPPDAELSSAAAQGRLSTHAQLKDQALRLLASRATATGLPRFFDEHFSLSTVRAVANRDANLYPRFSVELMGDFASESDAFIGEVLWGDVEGKRKLATLLAGGFSMLNERLAGLYGVPGVLGAELRRTTLPSAERAGLLTQGSFLARLANEAEGDVVKRGRFVREQLLCGAIPPPPANVNAIPPPPTGDVSQRERMAQHSADTTCVGCHQLMDPLGFGFLGYDALGAYQTVDAGKPIDQSGTVPDAMGAETPYVGAVELSQRLATAPAVQACFSQKLHRYVSGRAPQAADPCAASDAAARFEKSQGDVLELAADLVASEALATRREAP